MLRIDQIMPYLILNRLSYNQHIGCRVVRIINPYNTLVRCNICVV